MPAAQATHPETIAGYNLAAERYRDWWAPVIAPAAVRLLDLVEEALPAGGPSTIVDIGTGAGTLAFAALDRWSDAEVIAVDPTARLLEIVAAEAGRRGDDVGRRLRLLDGSAAKLPLPDASADAAVSSFVIQLIPSRAAGLREARRVLRRGGIFACVTWLADNSPFEPDEVFYDIVDDMRIELPPPGRDPRPYASPSVAAGELRRAGFEDVRATTEWLEHRYTPESFAGMLEHWAEDEVFERIDARQRDELRTELIRRLSRLSPDELVSRRPLVSMTGRRP
jgi:ubiquinone/menaquinone biosynthesis C-methylase UbiE